MSTSAKYPMNLRHYIRLIAFKSYADLRAERERTYLGLLWWVLEPIMFMLVFYLVFGLIRGRGGLDFVAFLLVGVVTWQWFRACVGHCSTSVLSGLKLLTQVPLPPAIFPLIAIVTDTFKFGIVLLLLLLVLAAIGYPPGLSILALPLVLVVQGLLATAFGMLYAAMVPFVPDLRHVIDTLLMAMMFVSGVFFAIDRMQPPFNEWLYLNPMAGLISDMRAVLIDGVFPAWVRLGYIAVFSLSLLLVAIFVYRRFGDRYTKLPR